MELDFTGGTDIAAPAEFVFTRLMDPHAIGACVPLMQSVEAADHTHYRVNTGVGRTTLGIGLGFDVEVTGSRPPEHVSYLMRGRVVGSLVEIRSTIQLESEGLPTRLRWAAAVLVRGPAASMGTNLLGGTLRRFTEEFWREFGRRTAEEAGGP